MKKLIFPLLMAALLLASCGPKYETGDLIFVRGQGGMSDAVSASTGDITHVGIVLCTDSGTYIADATPERGVALTPIRDFLLENPDHELVRPTFEYNKPFFDNEIRLCLGADYDSAFLPGNMAYYCSELVWTCYRDAQGRPLAPTQPMTFLDSTGQLPQYWADWFARIGRPVPEGVPGTNPSDIHRWIKNEPKMQK